MFRLEEVGRFAPRMVLGLLGCMRQLNPPPTLRTYALVVRTTPQSAQTARLFSVEIPYTHSSLPERLPVARPPRQVAHIAPIARARKCDAAIACPCRGPRPGEPAHLRPLARRRAAIVGGKSRIGAVTSLVGESRGGRQLNPPLPSTLGTSCCSSWESWLGRCSS